MRFTASILGLELDVNFGPATAAEDEADPLRDLGALGSTPISFISFITSPPVPAEWQPPERTIPWEPEDREGQ